MLNIIGFGPGGYAFMTQEAIEGLEASELIIGYTTYIDIIRPYFPHKQYAHTPMMQEVERCQLAIEESKDKEVALVCSGDSGIYGMASLIYELAPETFMDEEYIHVIPGVTAAASGGSVLGAPLSHDFLTVSLSDLLTPYEQIKKRITCAAMTDTAMCIYNPSSKKRGDYLREVCELMMQYQSPDTVCGYVKHIGREGQSAVVTTLRELRDTQVDMFTTVFIGNSQTKNKQGKMVTPRGYRNV